MEKLKSENGVTLTELVVYILVLSIVMGIMASISNFFYGNLDLIKDSAKYAGEFDKINSNLIVDVKANNHAIVNNDDKTIIFEDGTTYKYSAKDEGVYRGNNRIAINVKAFSVSKKTIVINSVEKDILTVNVIIGNSSKNLINKKIDYTLKYW